jgi:ferrochelatase
MRLAVVVFNLGGPDSPQAIEPFLFNLFSDPAIIGLPQPLRWLVAKWVAGRRAPVARGIYAKIGGRSPILANTEAQAEALAKALAELGDVRVFVAMRYWHPSVEQAAAAVGRFAPERIVLLPLYPQFSTTTTTTALRAWDRAAGSLGLSIPTARVCCYPDDAGFVAANADLLRQALATAAAPVRILFSAHGLPEKIVKRGDAYPRQVERTAGAVMERLRDRGGDTAEWAVCYQSRVGPLKWIGPSTEDEIRRAAVDGKGAVVVPIAFVSEHSETLVELDIEYRHLAESLGARPYIRVPAVGTHPDFIRGLADLVRRSALDPPGCRSGPGRRLCPADSTTCLMA